jgi:hypothetical protein
MESERAEVLALAREGYKLFSAIFRCTGISGTMGISCFLACPHFIYTLCQASRRAAVAKSQSHSLPAPYNAKYVCLYSPLHVYLHINTPYVVCALIA